MYRNKNDNKYKQYLKTIKQSIIEDTEGSKKSKKYTTEKSINVNYSSDKGFYFDGNFCFAIKSNNATLEAKTKKFNNTGLFLNSDLLKNNNISVKVIEGGRDTSNEYKNLSNHQKITMEIEGHYYEDFQFLFDKYIYDILYSKIVNVQEDNDIEKDKKLIEAINDRDLHSSVSNYISNIVNSYNESYFRNLDKIYSIESDSGISSKYRFDICTNDERFIKSIKTNETLFQIELDSKSIKKSNIRGIKEFAISDLLFSIDLTPFEKDAEMKLADYDRTGGLGALIRFNNIKSKFKKEIGNLPPMITEKEKERIKEIEIQIMNYSATEEILKEYQEITKNIWDKFVDIKVAYKSFDMNCKDYGVNGNLQVIEEFKKIEEKISDLRHQQSDYIASYNRHKQNQALSEEINKHASVMEDGTTYLDFEKKAIIDKIKEITSVEVLNENDELRKMNMIQSLKPSLEDMSTILQYIETTSGLKKAFAGNMYENARRGLFGEHYKQKSMKELYNLIVEAKEQEKEIETMVVKGLSSFVQTTRLNDEELTKMVVDIFKSDDDFETKMQKLEEMLKQESVESSAFSAKRASAELETSLNLIKNNYRTMKKNEFIQLERSLSLKKILNEAEEFLTTEVSKNNLPELRKSMKINLLDTESKQVNSLITSIDDLFDDKKQNLNLYKLLKYRASLESMLSKSENDEMEVERITKVITYVDEKLLNYPVELDPKQETIYKKDRDVYLAISNFLETMKDKKHDELLKNPEYKALYDKKQELEKELKSLTDKLDGNEENKKFGIKIPKRANFDEKKIKDKIENISKQIDLVDEKMAQMLNQADTIYGISDEKLLDLAKKIELSLESSREIDKENVKICKNLINEEVNKLFEKIKNINNDKKIEDKDITNKDFSIILNLIRDKDMKFFERELSDENSYLSKILSNYSSKDIEDIKENIGNIYKLIDSKENTSSIFESREAINECLRDKKINPIDIEYVMNIYDNLIKDKVEIVFKDNEHNYKLDSFKVQLIELLNESNEYLEDKDGSGATIGRKKFKVENLDEALKLIREKNKSEEEKELKDALGNIYYKNAEDKFKKEKEIKLEIEKKYENKALDELGDLITIINNIKIKSMSISFSNDTEDAFNKLKATIGTSNLITYIPIVDNGNSDLNKYYKELLNYDRGDVSNEASTKPLEKLEQNIRDLRVKLTKSFDGESSKTGYGKCTEYIEHKRREADVNPEVIKDNTIEKTSGVALINAIIDKDIKRVSNILNNEGVDLENLCSILATENKLDNLKELIQDKEFVKMVKNNQELESLNEIVSHIERATKKEEKVEIEVETKGINNKIANKLGIESDVQAKLEEVKKRKEIERFKLVVEEFKECLQEIGKNESDLSEKEIKEYCKAIEIPYDDYKKAKEALSQIEDVKTKEKDVDNSVEHNEQELVGFAFEDEDEEEYVK